MAIQFVGGNTASKVGATSGTTTIALGSGLSGGIAAAVAADDLVLAAFATGSVADRTLTISNGYTLIASELYSNDTFDTNLRFAYKFMGGTPDTTTIFGPTGNANDAGAMAVYVFRGVDLTTPLDVAAVTSSAINGSLVIPPDITPSTAGAFPVVVGAAAHNGGVDTFGSSDLTDFHTVGGNDTNDVTLGIGHQANWVSGATNFATWTHSQATSNSYSWASITIALRPAATPPITGSGSLLAQAADVTGTGTSRSLGAGALAAQAPDLSGTGLVRWVATGALAAQAAALSGAGTVTTPAITGTGALAAQSATASGVGLSKSLGAGTLAAPSATASGAGLSKSLGTGVLAAQSAAVSGAGTVPSNDITGTGALAAQSATLSGTGLSKALGAGTLTAQSATVSGAGASKSLGLGTLGAQAAVVTGSGAIDIEAITGAGVLVAQAAMINAISLVKGRATNMFGTPWIYHD